MEFLRGLIFDCNKKAGYFVLFFVVSAIFSFGVNANAYAIDPAPNCTSGEIIGDGLSNPVTMILNCQNSTKFVGSDGLIARSDDLVKIHLHQSLNDVNPFYAEIAGTTITMKFYLSDGFSNLDINIDANLIKNEIGQNNLAIFVSSSMIVDSDLPVAVNDSYRVGYGQDLNVPTETGVLMNDYDAETTSLSAELQTSPLFGDVVFNNDGSFTYSPNELFEGYDDFTYISYDRTGNPSTAATVYINPAELNITSDIYRDGEGDENYAKPDDIVAVDLMSEELILVNSVQIGGREASIYKIDDMHYMATRVVDVTDTEGKMTYTANISDGFGNENDLTFEDWIIFDKTIPIIELNDAEVIDMEVHDTYLETVTVNDNIDKDIEIVITGDMNADSGGEYILTYYAADIAGNQATPLTRLIRVADSIKSQFAEIHGFLVSQGIESNLNEVNIDNYSEFSGLVFEKSGLGKITFESPIDVLSPGFEDLIFELEDRLIIEKGLIRFNFNDLADDFVLRGQSARLVFERLDLLGYTKDQNVEDILKNLSVFDDEVNEISQLDILLSPGSFARGNYSYSVDVLHFTTFRIGRYVAPVKLASYEAPVEVNNNEDQVDEISYLKDETEISINKNSGPIAEEKSVIKTEKKIIKDNSENYSLPVGIVVVLLICMAIMWQRRKRAD